MYKKIDIYVNGEYKASTNMSKTLKEAKEKFQAKYNPMNKPTFKITCIFA